MLPSAFLPEDLQSQWEVYSLCFGGWTCLLECSHGSAHTPSLLAATARSPFLPFAFHFFRLALARSTFSIQYFILWRHSPTTTVAGSGNPTSPIFPSVRIPSHLLPTPVTPRLSAHPSCSGGPSLLPLLPLSRPVRNT